MLCQTYKNTPLPPGFRVIDVARRCITEMDSCQFIALSYVWGAHMDLYAATYMHNIKELMTDGSLTADKLPRTLADAITICEQLRERYLWIDRLCIVQDNADDKQRQIEAMGHIYSAAKLVIIAAHGNGARFGIPGVSRPRCVGQRRVNLYGLTTTSLALEKVVEPLTIWNTRGCT
jgi:hypothetical protein